MLYHIWLSEKPRAISYTTTVHVQLIGTLELKAWSCHKASNLDYINSILIMSFKQSYQPATQIFLRLRTTLVTPSPSQPVMFSLILIWTAIREPVQLKVIIIAVKQRSSLT